MAYNPQDYYFKQAKKEHFPARSVYKLQEIDRKFRLFSVGDTVVDFGYYPGSWSLYACKKIGSKGRIIGIDTKPPKKDIFLKNTTFFQRDIFSLDGLSTIGLNDQVDIILSDMAPATTGIKSVDQLKSFHLVEKVFDLLKIMLKPGGKCVVKFFDGHDVRLFLKNQKTFHHLKFFRPKSTRPGSKECFIIGLDYRV